MSVRNEFYDLFVGTYTERLPHVDGQAPGIMRARWTGEGGPGEATLAAVLRNPSWVTIFKNVLYAVSETRSDNGEGDVSAYRIDEESHRLVLLGMQPSGGADPAHLAVSPDGRYLAVANYSGGSVALFALEEGAGRIGERLDVVRHEGSGTDPSRQEAPHPHMAAFDPQRQDLYVPDLGLDAVLVYRVDEGRLVPKGRIDCPARTGPRHLAFHPSGDVFFLVGELGNTLSTFRRSESGFVPVGSVPLLPQAERERGTESSAAAVRVHSSGTLVFASNRGHDSVSIFRYGNGDALELIGCVPTQGQQPRDIAFTPDEQHLLVAHQNSGSVAVFAVDAGAQGEKVLSYVRDYQVPTPVCLAWA
ncbi:lactonase family protein [Kineosporia mesophila]|uniref:Lactonase family protein n=1 Tax=Kineosporia mesophila TaxID=566012 RepID=A0ABP6ZM41_9ACTN|nr:lactonase family protein [Kineosporia mesophila]MCD5349426.1 lactonase family protein [Kineosporia mesophila]